MSKHVAVLMGGWSAEREISLRSGKACAEALGENVRRRVKENSGVELEWEIERIGVPAPRN